MAKKPWELQYEDTVVEEQPKVMQDPQPAVSSGAELPEQQLMPSPITGEADDPVDPTAPNRTRTRTSLAGQRTGPEGVRKGLETSLMSDAYDLGRGAVQGATFGFRDEAYGALSALTAEALEIFGGEEGEFGERYQEARDESRAEDEAARERSPWLYGAGEVTGAGATMFLPGGVFAQAGRAANLATRATGVTSRVLGQTASRTGAGALVGGTYGAGFSEAETGDELLGDIALGSTVGAALPLMGSAGGALMRGTADVLAPTMKAAMGIPAAALRTAGSGQMILSRILQSTKDRKIAETLTGGLSEAFNAGAKVAKKEGGFIKRELAQTFEDVGRGSGIAKSALTGFTALPVAAIGSRSGRLFHKIADLLDDPQVIMSKIQGTKFEQALGSAMKRGKEATNAAIYTLMNDPEFRQIMEINLSEVNE